MKILKKYWKLLVGLALIGAAAFLYYNVYQTELTEYETKSQQLKTMITGLENSIRENNRYVDIQEELERISIAVETLQLWSERMLATGAIDEEQYNAHKNSKV